MVQTSSEVKKFQTEFNQSFLSGLNRGSLGLSDFRQQLMSAGDAAGLGASQLGRMADASGLFTDAQIAAARASAATADKAAELSRAVANGTMTTYEAGRAFREFADANQILVTDMNAVANASLAVGAAFGTVAAAGASMIRSTTQLAARVETLGVVTAVMGRNIGMSEGQIRSLEKSIQEQGITTQASRQAIAQMIQAEIDLANATQLARLAQDAAVISGENSSQAFEQLVTVIASGNVVMARRMGLLVDFQGAYEREAGALGKSSQALTEQEKVQIRVNEVMRKGELIAGAYSGAMETAGKKAASLARLQEEAALAIGETFLPAYGSLIDTTTDVLKAFNDLEDGQKKAAGEALGYVTAITAAEAATFLTIGTVIKASTAFRGLAAAMGLSTIAAASIALPVAVVTALAVALFQLNASVKEIQTDNLDSLTQAIRDSAAASQDATRITNDYLEKQKQIANEMRQGTFTESLSVGAIPTSNLKELELSVRGTSDSYQEYISNMQRAAKAAGLLIDAEGNLVQTMTGRGGETQKTIAALFAQTEAVYNSIRASDEMTTAHEAWRLGLKYTSMSAQELTTQLQMLQEAISGRLGPEYDAFIEKQNELRDSADQMKGKIAELEGLQYRTPEQQAQLDDLVGQLGNVNLALEENAAAHEDSTRRIVWGMAAQRAAMDGYTEDEFTLLNNLALAWGILDQKSWETMNSVNQALTTLDEGGSIEDAERKILNLADALVSVSGDYYIRIHLETVGQYPEISNDAGVGVKIREVQTKPTSATISGTSGGRIGGGGGGARPLASAASSGPEPKTALQIAMETAQAASSAGSTAASILQRQTIDPLKQQIEAIDKLMSPGHIDLMAMEQRVELERKRAEMTEKVAEAEARVLELQKQQDRLNLLQSQLRLLDLIRENKLDAGNILQGLKVGQADMGQVVEAMARAVGMLVDKAEAELGIASPSKKAEWMMRMYWAGAVKGIEGGLPVVKQAMSGAMNAILPAPDSMPVFNAQVSPYLRQPYDDRQPYVQGGNVTRLEVNLPLENINSMIDVESLAYRVADVIKRRIS